MRKLKPSKVQLFILLVAGLCFIRAMSVQARMRDPGEETEVEEVYDATDDSDSNDQKVLTDVRLTRPQEAAERRFMEPGEEDFEQIPGAEHLKKTTVARQSQTSTRAPASAVPVPTRPLTVNVSPEVQATSPIPVRDEKIFLQRESTLPPNDPLTPRRIVRGVQEASVIASEYGYFPKNIFLTQGIPAKIFLSTTSKNTQCFMIDGLGVKKGISPGNVEEVSFLPDRTGDFRFYCPIGSIEGKVTVRAPASEVTLTAKE